MSEDINLSVSRAESRDGAGQEERRRGEEDWTQRRRRIDGQPGETKVIGTGVPYSDTIFSDAPPRRRYDPLRLLDALTRRWYWLAGCGLALGAGAFLLGILLTDYSVRVQLFRRTALNAFSVSGDALLQERSLQTLFSWMASAEVLASVGGEMDPPMTAAQVAEAVHFFPDRNPDFVNLIVSGKDPQRVVELANLYAEKAVAFTQKIQADEAGEISGYLTKQLSDVDERLAGVSAKITEFAREADVLDFEKEVEAYLAHRQAVDLKYETARLEVDMLGLRLNTLETELERQRSGNDQVQALREQLAAMLMDKNERHPDVEKLKANIARLEKTHAAEGTNTLAGFVRGNSFASALYLQILDLKAQREVLERQVAEYKTMRDEVHNRVKALSGKAAAYAMIKGERQNLDAVRQLVLNRQREAQLLHDNALGYFRVDTPAALESVQTNRRYLIIGGATSMGALIGVLLSAALLLLSELLDTRLKTAADVQRVTGLPVFATLGDLCAMTPVEQVNWAFRTLTILQGKLNGTPDKSLVCGFISSNHREGRSTWINLLVNAASQRGLRVLTVATRPSENGETVSRTDRNPSLLPVGPRTTLNTNVLAFPAQVTEQFSDADAQPVVHIPLPGWVWNLERRKQWQSALAQWRQIENMVMFIELPPASQPEAILLAENLPQVLWLTNSGMAEAEETRQHLETLRHAHCQVAGAVLNREPRSFWRTHFGGFIRWSTITLMLGLSLGAIAQEIREELPEEQRPESGGADKAVFAPGSFTAGKPEKLAPWQERLTLGPGDVLDFSLYGSPELTRTNMVVAPDGKISYLQAQDIQAAGLTVDELRATLDEALQAFYPAPRTIVAPVRFNSKKYYVLGKVVNRGAFTLDRPVTIIEAVARARGLETGLIERNTVETADLSRAILIRHGKRLPLDFERLFRQGDLSQNITLEPNDYLYFPPSDLNEVYVLGEVTAPGVSVFAPGTSVIGALSSRGGFTPKAYKRKVLVVRGSLESPETFVVDTAAVLAGRSPDFKLQPKDIVYVNARPWVKVEELLDVAAEAFIQAAVTAWVGFDVGPVINSPIFR